MNIYFEGALRAIPRYNESSSVLNERHCDGCNRTLEKGVPNVDAVFTAKLFAANFPGADLLLPEYTGLPVASDAMCEIIRSFGDPFLEIPAKIFVSRKSNAPITQVIDTMRALYPLRTICLDPLKSRKERIIDCPICGATSWRISGKGFDYDFSGEPSPPNFIMIQGYEPLVFLSDDLVMKISEILGRDVLDLGSPLKIGHWSV